MKPDRPLIGAVAALATGIGLIVGYCHGTTGLNAAYPFAGSTLHFDLTTTGPAVLGGLALIALGMVLMLWALLAAFVSQIARIGRRDEEFDSIVGRRREPSFEEHYPGSITAERKHEI